jgi:hypothetical protein
MNDPVSFAAGLANLKWVDPKFLPKEFRFFGISKAVCGRTLFAKPEKPLGVSVRVASKEYSMDCVVAREATEIDLPVLVGRWSRLWVVIAGVAYVIRREVEISVLVQVLVIEATWTKEGEEEQRRSKQRNNMFREKF